MCVHVVRGSGCVWRANSAAVVAGAAVETHPWIPGSLIPNLLAVRRGLRTVADISLKEGERERERGKCIFSSATRGERRNPVWCAKRKALLRMEGGGCESALIRERTVLLREGGRVGEGGR